MNHTTLQKRPIRLFTEGFSLVETLVAITLLLIAIAGVMTMAQGGLQSAVAAKDQMVATYLAQEASEYIRNVRDTNIIGQHDWNRYFYKCAPPRGCYIDSRYHPGPPLYWGMRWCASEHVCRLMNINPESTKYSYDNTWPITKYDRRVVVTPIRFDGVAIEEYLIEVTVSWTGTRGVNNLRLVSSLHRRD